MAVPTAPPRSTDFARPDFALTAPSLAREPGLSGLDTLQKGSMGGAMVSEGPWFGRPSPVRSVVDPGGSERKNWDENDRYLRRVLPRHVMPLYVVPEVSDPFVHGVV